MKKVFVLIGFLIFSYFSCISLVEAIEYEVNKAEQIGIQYTDQTKIKKQLYVEGKVSEQITRISN